MLSVVSEKLYLYNGVHLSKHGNILFLKPNSEGSESLCKKGTSVFQLDNVTLGRVLQFMGKGFAVAGAIGLLLPPLACRQHSAAFFRPSLVLPLWHAANFYSFVICL